MKVVMEKRERKKRSKITHPETKKRKEKQRKNLNDSQIIHHSGANSGERLTGSETKNERKKTHRNRLNVA